MTRLNRPDIRRPETLEELIDACLDSNADPDRIWVVPGHAVYVDMALRIIELERGR